MNAITLDGLSKQFAGGAGLQPTSLSVPTGQVFGFLGQNGAGKTTTIRTLLGFLRPTAGQAQILGHDVWHNRAAVHARVGYLPGEVKLRPGHTAREVLTRAAALRRVSPQGALQTAERLGLDVSRRVGTLSKGNRQKVGLCAALLGDPEVLILDEPTDGLDPLAQATVLALLREARAQGRTVFLSSHVLSEVEHVADQVAILRGGRLVRQETLSTLRAGLPQRLSVRFARPPGRDLGTLPGLSEVSRHDLEWRGVWRGPADTLLRALAAEEVASFSLTPFSLEDAFFLDYGAPGGESHVA
ncbi:ABC transporter ATP-binding protein [Deinococcus multiflagellatus]|uniref:ABC transporter ATP-binding protein n=1 Tax=Deinococcus multiflagellatus TaxID=1656887 RepID=UPI001CC9696A|nr:ABC transporter ATP-binding protein [Deinococcus multiflagellatus]MBZ9714539.1 ABC transporter ATP-binding protein [Deinococcus multiflagellatus]